MVSTCGHAGGGCKAPLEGQRFTSPSSQFKQYGDIFLSGTQIGTRGFAIDKFPDFARRRKKSPRGQISRFMISFNQSINQSTNQSINQSINQSKQFALQRDCVHVHVYTVCTMLCVAGTGVAYARGLGLQGPSHMPSSLCLPFRCEALPCTICLHSQTVPLFTLPSLRGSIQSLVAYLMS
jgi:hypothetical protein